MTRYLFVFLALLTLAVGAEAGLVVASGPDGRMVCPEGFNFGTDNAARDCHWEVLGHDSATVDPCADLLSAAEGVLPYLEGRIPQRMHCTGADPLWSDNCLMVVPGREDAIARFREAVKKAKEGR